MNVQKNDYQINDGCRGCKHARRDWTNPDNLDKYCNNEKAKHYGDNCDNVIACDEKEER